MMRCPTRFVSQLARHARVNLSVPASCSWWNLAAMAAPPAASLSSWSPAADASADGKLVLPCHCQLLLPQFRAMSKAAKKKKGGSGGSAGKSTVDAILETIE